MCNNNGGGFFLAVTASFHLGGEGGARGWMGGGITIIGQQRKYWLLGPVCVVCCVCVCVLIFAIQ